MNSDYKPTILIVEDDDVQLFNLQTIFAKKYSPVGVTSGSDCLKLFKEKMEFSGVITDFTLPDHDGFELISKIREIDAAIPILLYTAHNNYTISDFNDTLSKFNNVRYLQKPATVDELNSTANQFFEETILT